MKISGIQMSKELERIGQAGGQQTKGLLDSQKTPGDDTEKLSFGEFLSQKMSEVNARGVEAEHAIEAQLRGETLNPHSTLIAIQKASISLTLMMGIKTRLEQAYQELVRMQVG